MAVLDGLEKPFEHVRVLYRKRKRGGLMEDEISVFTSMTKDVKEVSTVIRESKTLDVHADMEQGGFSNEALMAVLSHLLDNKAEGVGFVTMQTPMDALARDVTGEALLLELDASYLVHDSVWRWRCRRRRRRR